MKSLEEMLIDFKSYSTEELQEMKKDREQKIANMEFSLTTVNELNVITSILESRNE